MELYEAIKEVSVELNRLSRERDELKEQLMQQLSEKESLIDSLFCCYNVLCEGMETKYRTLSDPERLAADYADEQTRKYAVKYLRDYMRTFFPNAKSIKIVDFILKYDDNFHYGIRAQVDEIDVSLSIPSYARPFSLASSTLMYKLLVGVWYKTAFDPAELIQK